MTGIAIALVVALLVVLVTRRGGGDVLASQSQGEIFLQRTDSSGPDPYTPSVASPTPSLSPVALTQTAAAPAGATVVQASSGSTPGLYGGTNNQSTCDPQALAAFLQAHPDKSAAWVAALNADPSLRWSGGSQVRVDQIPQYVAELTPVRLRSDTRVTNHGFAAGRATPFQAVLQAGTAVLVDSLGVPRTRCACGNPLTAPQAVTVKPTYSGDPPWPGFSPASVTAVTPAPSPIPTFVVVNLTNPTETLSLPAGTTVPQATAPSPSPTVLAAPTPTSGPATPPVQSPRASPTQAQPRQSAPPPAASPTPSPPPPSPSPPAPSPPPPAYHLSSIEIVRTYFGPGYPNTNDPHINPLSPGTTNYPPTTRQIQISWDARYDASGIPPNSDEQGVGTLTLTQVPTEITDNSPQQFAATMDGQWTSSGYAPNSSATEKLSLAYFNGPADQTEQTFGTNQNATGTITDSGSRSISYGGCCSPGGEARFYFVANIIFSDGGGVNGRIEITLHYS